MLAKSWSFYLHTNLLPSKLALDSGRESRAVSLKVSAAFDVNYKALILKLLLLEVCGKFSAVSSQFLIDRTQYVVVDGQKYCAFGVASGVPQSNHFFFFCSSLIDILYLTISTLI